MSHRGNGTGLESNVGPDQPGGITGRKPTSLDVDEREQVDTAYRGVHDNQI